MGTVSELYPEGVERLDDAPYSLHQALHVASTVLGWRADLDRDEIPPRRIWLLDEQLDDWFKGVQKRRDDKFGGKDAGPIEDPVQNAAAQDLVVG